MSNQTDQLMNEIKNIIKNKPNIINDPIKRSEKPTIITTRLNECPECGASKKLLAHIKSCLRCMSCGFTLCK
jgi:uncharacterized protein (DUF983 family)